MGADSVFHERETKENRPGCYKIIAKEAEAAKKAERDAKAMAEAKAAKKANA